MQSRRTIQAAAAALVLALGVTAIAGCSAVDDLLNPDQTHTYENKAGFVTADEVTADWVPDDSTKIRLRIPSDTTLEIAVILLASKSKLPASCIERERRSAPILTLDGAPSIYAKQASRVHVCGDWTVIPAKNGWYGWTPNSEDQEA